MGLTQVQCVGLRTDWDWIAKKPKYTVLLVMAGLKGEKPSELTVSEEAYAGYEVGKYYELRFKQYTPEEEKRPMPLQLGDKRPPPTPMPSDGK